MPLVQYVTFNGQSSPPKHYFIEQIWCVTLITGPVFTKLFEIDFQSQVSLSFTSTNVVALTKKILIISLVDIKLKLT